MRGRNKTNDFKGENPFLIVLSQSDAMFIDIVFMCSLESLVDSRHPIKIIFQSKI